MFLTAYMNLEKATVVKDNVKEVEEMMKRCSKYSGYDWKDPLKIGLSLVTNKKKKN